MERNPKISGVEKIVGLEQVVPDSLYVRRWNSIEDETRFTCKFVSGQLLTLQWRGSSNSNRRIMSFW
jgi:hypothetical protein